MHKDDQMTSRQRLEAFAKGEPIDRTPVMPFLSLIGPRLAGITLREMRNDPKQEAFFMVECYRILGHDGMTGWASPWAARPTTRRTPCPALQSSPWRT